MISSDTVSIYTGTSGFKLVTSGSDCQRIHDKELCKKAAVALRLFKHPPVTNYGTSRPPGCFTNKASSILALNTDTRSSTECSEQYPCVCFDVDCTNPNARPGT